MADTTLTCPNCGYGFAELQRATRMFDCPSCGTTLFRGDLALEPMGDHGEMHEMPMLFGLHDTIETGSERLTVIGHVRFDYGRGWWDEMWAIDGNGNGAWISIDEGDVVLQHPIAPDDQPRWKASPDLGSSFTFHGEPYTVTETDRGTAIAIRGELPEQLRVGEAHDFVNASGQRGGLISGEFWDGGRAWYEGYWLDPFEIRVERAA